MAHAQAAFGPPDDRCKRPPIKRRSPTLPVFSVLDTSLPASATTTSPRLHLASPADVPYIVDAIVAESRAGHFACDCSQPDVLRGLWHQVQTIVADGVAPMPGLRDGAGARAFVVQVGMANVGFAILAEHEPGSWHQRLELFALATHAAWRGRGVARHLVTSLVRDAGSAVIYARCAPASTAMVSMLRSCGFATVPGGVDGAVLLEFQRLN